MLYGGVSLAIYIYGVVYEFWRLVRASRGEEENAYTELLRKADAWATIDIVSGASAGGINGVLLGKALATGADLAAVRGLWVDGADFASLLRDPGEKDPPSLLRTGRFDELLSSGLAQMDRSGTKRELVDVLDLFVPGTRLRPRREERLDDLGQILALSQYRKIFHLKFRKRGYNEADPSLGYDRNDFRPPQNAILAQVARATSAFPVAFEPKLISRDDDSQILFDDGDPDSAWFSDGGILHNKPFTEALGTIFTRAAERPVRRWLLAIEPDPEHFVAPPGPEVYPEAPEVVSKALMGIPRYQSIVSDLDDLRAHRRRVERAQRLLAAVEQIAADVDSAVLEDDARFQDFLDGQVLYAAYDQLRRESLAAQLREELMESVAFDRPGQPGSVASGATAFARGLSDADLAEGDPGFATRRVYYLLEALKRVREALDSDARTLLAPFQRRLWAEFDRIAQALWDEFENPANPRAAALRQLAPRVDADLRDAVAEALAKAAAGFRPRLDEVRERVEEICGELDEALEAAAVPADAVPIAFTTIFRRYVLWDLFILPIDHLSDAGERDRVGFIRISPEAATYVRKEASQKLAGDALGHFGGFARQEWRENDILWGRLDAAEVIARLLLEDASRAELEQAIRSAQTEVMSEERPDVASDYRTFLEQRYRVGSQTVAAIPMQDRATFLLDVAGVTRNMMRRLSKANLSRGLPRLLGWVGRLLGFALLLTRWPVLAIWGRDLAVRRVLTLLLLFLAAWAVLSIVLVLVFDIADVGERFWILAGIAIGMFFVWVVFLSIARGLWARLRRRRR